MAKKTNVMALLAIIVGILVIIKPTILAYAVGLYLIITGAMDLVGK